MGFAAGKSWEEIDCDCDDKRLFRSVEMLTMRQIRNRFEKLYPDADLMKDSKKEYVNVTTQRYFRVFLNAFTHLKLIKNS